jgi:serine/threonine-protein kinase HipA
VTTLVVHVGGIRAGLLHQSNEGSFFELDDDYLSTPNRPVLGQIFEDDPTRPHRTRQGVPPWFANLLPEGPLRQLIAERAGVSERRSWFLLKLLGDDLPGAVTIETPELQSLEDEPEPLATDPEELPLRFSLAGVQMKFSAIMAGRGLTIPAQGQGGDWIVKLPDLRFQGVPENEYLMMQLAGRSGIEVPTTTLVPVGSIANLPERFTQSDSQALAVQRFDRSPTGRVHIEDFAQVLDVAPRKKYGATNYETMARVIAAVCRDHDVDEFIRRLVFMIAIGNSDAHAKNWSLVYPDGRSACLAPAYDLVAVSLYEKIESRLRPQLALNLAGVRDSSVVTHSTFQYFARRAGLDGERVAMIVDDAVHAIRASWDEVKNTPELPHSPDLRAILDERIGNLPLFR